MKFTTFIRGYSVSTSTVVAAKPMPAESKHAELVIC